MSWDIDRSVVGSCNFFFIALVNGEIEDDLTYLFRLIDIFFMAKLLYP
jgi:hypothetical protein